MRLTRFTDNALRCLLYLAATPSRTATVSEVAERMGMSADQLLKVIQRLVALGYVRTIRGRNGGVTLAKDAAAISVAEVVRATEPSLALVPCFEPCNTECPLTGSCLLADALAESLGAFFGVLEQRTVADLVAAPRTSRVMHVVSGD
ncbi:MAG TPA: Rrf2 family transcriptional regulator [Gemmatimonadaceae bacterium]|jgi:Rrf2 family nitric oxide-sensitive transcriptional repressor